MASGSGNFLKNHYVAGILISIGVVLISYWFSFTAIFETIENKSYDQRFESRGTEPGFSDRARVVIVGNDDQAIDNLPANYPFPRAYYGRFIHNMNRTGASAVGIDILFDGVDMKNQESDSVLRVVLGTYKNVVLAGRTETESVSGDRYEIKTSDSLYLRNIFYDINKGVKLGLIYVPSDRDNVTRRYAISHQASNGQIFPTFAFGIVQYLDNVESGRDLNEFVIKKENDIVSAGKYSAPVWDGYTIFLNYYGPAQTFTYIGLDKVLDDSTLVTKAELANAEQVAEDFEMSLEEVLYNEELYNQWAEDLFDNSRMKRLAAIYEDATDEELASYDQLAILQSGVLKNKIVLVGSANPEDKDMLAIPMRKGDARQSNLTYGVEIHATAVQNLLDGNNIKPIPDWLLFLILFIGSYLVFVSAFAIKHMKIQNQFFYNAVNFLFVYGIIYLAAYIVLVMIMEYEDIILFPIWISQPTMLSVLGFMIPYTVAAILAGVVTWFMNKRGLDRELSMEFANILFVILMSAVVIQISQLVFNNMLIMMKIVPLISSILFGYVGSIAYQYLTESAQKKVIKGIFSHYVNKEVVDKMLDNPEAVRLGGEKVNMTVMFSDLSGFTTISEMLTPEALVDLLNEYLGSMTEIILEAGGTLDKYIGDAIMAFWGAPIHQEQHAVSCCRSVMAQQRKLKELADIWVQRGFPRLIARFGVNTGDMVVGNMGSSNRFNYTVMGDSVNLAARLEPANKEFDTLVMISEFTYERVKDEFICRQLDLLQVKGKTKPVTVYELMADRMFPGDYSQMDEIVRLYNDGLRLYYAQKWDDAVAQFQKVLSIDPEDGPSKTYIKRCKDFKENPPGEDWSGVYVMKHK